MMRQLFLAMVCVFYSLTALAAANQTLTQREDVKTFVQHMVKQHQFNRKQLENWLNQVEIQQEVLTSIAKPAESLPWYRYEPIFLTSDRIKAGVAFWQDNKVSLEKASKKYGVPPEIIVSILGVESFYGQKKGKYPVFDSLATLAFDYPPRSKFFKDELEQFLLLAREQNWDPKSIRGSYAGAMGCPQFIASSYHHYAVDFNQDGKRDLINSIDDAIGSVAHYFHAHGWEANRPIAIPAKSQGDRFEKMIASRANPKPVYKIATLAEAGVKPKIALPAKDADLSFALIALQNKENKDYWLGAQNFYVITRYNHSEMYAMVVYLLSERIKAEQQTAKLAQPLKQKATVKQS